MLKPVATVVLILLSTLAALHADVTTMQRTIVKTIGHGVLDDLRDQTSGGAQGKSARVAYSGERFVVREGDFGTIVDVKESRLYRLNYRDQQYSATSFEDERNAVSKRRSALENSTRDLSQPSTATTFGSDPLGDRPFRPASRKTTFDIAVETTESADQRTIAGSAAHMVKVVVRGRDKDQRAGSDAWVLTANVWSTASNTELDALARLRERYCRAVLDQPCLGLNPDVALDLSVTEPAFKDATVAMSRALAVVTGTIVSSAMTFERAKSDDELKQDEFRRQTAQNDGVRVLGGPPSARPVVLTFTQEYTSVTNTVALDELTVPYHFRLRKPR